MFNFKCLSIKRHIRITTSDTINLTCIFESNRPQFSFEINFSNSGSRAGIKFATPMLVVPTSRFFKKSNKIYLQSRSKDNKVWIRWWSQVNYSLNQTLFIVNYEGFLIDWIYAHTGHTTWKSTMNNPIITLQFQKM